jgi:DNA mismatch endonuclease (patch repair protein)
MERQFYRDGRAPIPLDVGTSLRMSGNKGKHTKPELIIRKALWRDDIKGYRLHWKKILGQPDITFPSRKFAIFINGCFWHRCPHCKPHLPRSNELFWIKKFEANVQRDQRKNIVLADMGWQTITIWECQIKKDINEQIKLISDVYHAL